MSGYIAKDDLIELLSDMQGRCGTRAELRQNSKIWQQVKDMPTVDAIPIEYIEAKKKTLYCFIEIEVKHGDMDEAFRLERKIAVMNEIIADWRYDARLKRRWERGDE